MTRFGQVAAILLFLCGFFAQAQDNNAGKSDKQSSSSFMDASSDSKPREISLGLPNSKVGSVPIFEDGLPVSINITPIFPFKSWHSGVSAQMSNIGPMESAMRYNEISSDAIN